MAMPNLSEFDPDGDPRNVSNRWTKWVHDFRAAMVSFKITCEKRQRALLRFYRGDELTDILESLNDTGTEDEIEPAIEALTRYFTPARNCEEKGHSGHAQDKECSGHVRGRGGEIHHFTRCCGSSVQSVRPYIEGDKSNVKTDTDEKSAKNTYKRETMTGNNQNTHTGKETKAALEKKSPTREVKHEKSPTREVKHENPSVREVKHENPPPREVKQKKSPNREVTQMKLHTRAMKQRKLPTRKVKFKNSHKRDVKQNDPLKRDVKQNDPLKRDVKQNDSLKRDVKQNDSHKGDVKQNDSHKGDVKQNDSHKGDVKQNDSHKGDVKQNDSHKGDVKQNDSHKGDVKPNDSHKGDVKPNDSHKGDVKQKDSHQGDVKQNDSHQGDVKQNDSYKGDVNQKDSHKDVYQSDSYKGNVKRNDSHKRDVNKINRKHVRKRVVDQNLHKRRDVNKINTEDEVKQETTAVNTVIWKINNMSAGKSVKKKQITRREKGNERHSTEKSHVKYSIIAGNKVHFKDKEYKSDMEPPDIRDREEPEQAVIQPRHHHKSRPPNSYDYVAN